MRVIKQWEELICRIVSFLFVNQLSRNTMKFWIYVLQKEFLQFIEGRLNYRMFNIFCYFQFFSFYFLRKFFLCFFVLVGVSFFFMFVKYFGVNVVIRVLRIVVVVCLFFSLDCYFFDGTDCFLFIYVFCLLQCQYRILVFGK